MVETARRADAERFIRESLPLSRAHGLDGLKLYRATPSSGLTCFLGDDGETPYWAYPWPGGLALARHLFEHPELVRGRSILDFGAGSGLVAIAAMRCGAAKALAVDTDPLAEAAIGLNAEANDVAVSVRIGVIAPQDVAADIVLAADTFYSAAVADSTMAFLTACALRGKQVLVGDIGRRYLPRDGLDWLAEYEVPDIGDATLMQPGHVFALRG